jgi:NADH-quinone oxidoreductase subunit J
VTDPHRIAVLLAAALLAVGVWLMLPGGGRRRRGLGALATAVGLGLLASRLPGVGDWLSQSVFTVLAAVTVISAAAAITFRTPVYCALWLGLSLAGTAGLFSIQGAQFLAVATIVVYAGAILVTFLFLLMLAESGGRARYDRTSWEGMLSAFAGAVLAGLLSMTVTGVLDPRNGLPLPAKVTAQQREQNILDPEHVHHIGKELFDLSDGYLIAAEAAGVLLLAALVGAAVIVGPLRKTSSGPDDGEEHAAASGGENATATTGRGSTDLNPGP